ncbi:hypothetical protein CAP36_16450 [Chitinophagaceae bacterium IBVUCB2]|nr:hypothetical protein CAP36_16450 [Chitinophagaceae bacterium IBVUCB2]
MVYRAIGLADDTLSAGLNITFTEFQEQAGKWIYEVLQTEHFIYEENWKNRLADAANLSIQDFQLLQMKYGEYLGQQINKFMEQYQLHYKVALIAFEGYSILSAKSPVQLGDGAIIASITQLPVINNFYSIDIALGGQRTDYKVLKEKLGLGSSDDVISNTIIVAFMGILRWRQEYNVFAAETGASRNSIGGALWTGQDA